MLVTIIAKEGRKIVEQFDALLPVGTKYIAQDKCGGWCDYKMRPVQSKIFDWWIPLKNDYDLSEEIMYGGKPNPDWRESLIKVADIK